MVGGSAHCTVWRQSRGAVGQQEVMTCHPPTGLFPVAEGTDFGFVVLNPETASVPPPSVVKTDILLLAGG